MLVPAEGQRRWLYGSLSGRAGRRLPSRPRRSLARVEERARVRVSRPLLTATRAARRARGGDVDAIDAYLAAIENADALVVSGGGFVTDAFGSYALVVLRELELAIRRKTPTFMFGQGIGPIDDRDLRRAAARVLPQVDGIGVREGRTSPELLTALGVDPSRISVTGDDALELALAHRVPPALGDMLGVNVRVAGYSPLSGAAADQLARGVLDAAGDHDARLLAVPISRHPGESDLETVRRMFPDVEGADTETAEDAIEAAARCRVVVTGSYHAAFRARARHPVRLPRDFAFLPRQVSRSRRPVSRRLLGRRPRRDGCLRTLARFDPSGVGARGAREGRPASGSRAAGRGVTSRVRARERAHRTATRVNSQTISVAVSTLDRPEGLRRCLDALLAGSAMPDEIVVVDQGDGARTESVLSELAPAAPVIVHVKRCGSRPLRVP